MYVKNRQNQIEKKANTWVKKYKRNTFIKKWNKFMKKMKLNKINK